MGIRVLGKIEIVAVVDEEGNIKYENDLSYYAPGQFAFGCQLLDLACDVFSSVTNDEAAHD